MKNIQITKSTEMCISIAASPGNFGSLVFNRTFKTLSMDYVYKPFLVTPQDLSKAVIAIKCLSIKGCGVSMPHKTVIHRYLDVVDPVAKQIGAINTIVNKNGVLTGYNTDMIGVEKALEKFFPIKGKTAHIIGAGGASRAIIVAMLRGGAKEIIVSNRDEKKSQKLAKEFGVRHCLNKNRKDVKTDILVNATPVGMSPNTNHMIIEKSEFKNYQAIMDVVVSPMESLLIKTAKMEKKIVIPGYIMALNQAAEQFSLYTGMEAPVPVMMRHVKNILKQK